MLTVGGLSTAGDSAAQTSNGTQPVPVPYESPFPSPHTGGPAEAADFAKLQQLFDKHNADMAAWLAASACGGDDRWKAKSAAEHSGDDLNLAIDEFARQWSDTLYPTKPDQKGNLPEATSSDATRIVAELKKHGKKYAVPACPPKPGATTPPPASPPAPPPCDDGTAAAKIAAAEKELALVEADISRIDRVVDVDAKAYDTEVKVSGENSAKSHQLENILAADGKRLKDLRARKFDLEDTIKDLKALKPCPSTNAVPAPAPAPPPPPAPLPPCDDGSNAAQIAEAQRELDHESELVEVATSQLKRDIRAMDRTKEAFGESSDQYKAAYHEVELDVGTQRTFRAREAEAQKRLDALKALKKCPKPNHHASRPIGEDDPRYMEGVQLPANSAPGQRPDSSSHASAPSPQLPPQDDGDNGTSTPDNPYARPPDVPLPGDSPPPHH
jgi:hypothetical protein